MSTLIEDYIRANGNRYTRDSIRARLIEAGHDPEEVDRVWEELQLERSAGDLVSWARALFVIGFVVVAGGFLVGIGFLNALGSQSSANADPLIAVLLVVAYSILGLVFIGVTRWVAWRRRLGGLLSFAAYSGVFVVMAAAVIGTCATGISLIGS